MKKKKTQEGRVRKAGRVYQAKNVEDLIASLKK